jgi:hypothetical protein
MLVNFGTLAATGATPPVVVGAAQTHTVQVSTTGAPASLSLQLEGSLDDTPPIAAWGNLSGPQAITATPTVFHVTSRVVRSIRINVTALSSGTVSVKYLGV